jgi:hypothetical protein
MTDLVDPGDLSQVPGSTPRNWFMGWAVAAMEGQRATGLVHRWLTDLCDYALCLNGYEDVLAELGPADQQAQPAPPAPERESVTNVISGGTQHGPVLQGRDFTDLSFGSPAAPPIVPPAEGPGT